MRQTVPCLSPQSRSTAPRSMRAPSATPRRPSAAVATPPKVNLGNFFVAAAEVVAQQHRCKSLLLAQVVVEVKKNRSGNKNSSWDLGSVSVGDATFFRRECRRTELVSATRNKNLLRDLKKIGTDARARAEFVAAAVAEGHKRSLSGTPSSFQGHFFPPR